MINPIISCFCLCYLMACSTNKNTQSIKEMPSCLDAKIKTMKSAPSKGSPLSVIQYTYKEQTVYYMVSPCCDKYNVVYDSVCNVLGYPDGGFTGRGDGKMSDFYKEVTNKKIIWEKNNQQ